MNTRSVKEFLVALTSGGLGVACSPWLFTDVPIGEPVESLAPAEWNGAWLDASSGTIGWIRVALKGSSLEVLERSGGSEVSQLSECPDESNVKFESLLPPSWSPLRRHSTWYLPEKKDPKTGYYSYGATLDPMLRNERGALITSQFLKPAVQQMVRNAELPGEVQPNGDVMLRGLQKEHIDKLIATVWLEPFGVVARLPRELDPCRGALTESARARAFIGE